MVRPISPFASDNTNPAGGINSNAEDMALWLRVQLAGGILPDGSRLFSPGIARQLTTMVTPIPVGDPPPEVAALKSNFVGYALGFGVRDYRGHKVVTHTGGLPGYVSKVLMIPGCRLGICVLTNQESSEAFDAITYWIADYYLGAPGTNWLEAYTKLSKRQAGEEVEADKRVAAGRDPSSRPSLVLAKYAGLYRDAWYGDITLAEEKGRLVLRFLHTPQLVGELEPFQHDAFIVRWRDRELRADAFITFSLNPDGSIDQAKMQAFSRSTDFSFDFHDLLLKPVSAPLTIR
jgi:CubicO group peptidase (beta-lactamase class C family)